MIVSLKCDLLVWCVLLIILIKRMMNEQSGEEE